MPKSHSTSASRRARVDSTAVAKKSNKKPEVSPTKGRGKMQAEVVIPTRKTKRNPSPELDDVEMDSDESGIDELQLKSNVTEAEEAEEASDAMITKSEDESSGEEASPPPCKVSGKALKKASKKASAEDDPFDSSSETSQTVVAGSASEAGSASGDIKIEEVEPSLEISKIKTCGVDKRLCNHRLRHTITNLPKLQSGCSNLSWKIARKGEKEEGMASFSMMRDCFPNLDIPYFESLLTFAGDRRSNVFNISRVQPSVMTMKAMNEDGNNKYKYFFHGTQTRPAMCLTLGIIHEDYTNELKSNGSGVASKFVAAVPLTYEYERWVAATSMIIGDGPVFKSQIVDNELVFSTRPDTSAAKKRNNATTTPNGKSRMTSAKKSPATLKKKSSSTDKHRFYLMPDDDIPVFDGRFAKIAVPQGFRDVPTNLPPFRGEIPYESLALIAYSTCAYYQKEEDTMKSIALNAIWVVVLDCPEDVEDHISDEMWHDGPIRSSMNLLVPGLPVE